MTNDCSLGGSWRLAMDTKSEKCDLVADLRSFNQVGVDLIGPSKLRLVLLSSDENIIMTLAYYELAYSSLRTINMY
jgi:hypothetical protein